MWTNCFCCYLCEALVLPGIVSVGFVSCVHLPNEDHDVTTESLNPLSCICIVHIRRFSRKLCFQSFLNVVFIDVGYLKT